MLSLSSIADQSDLWQSQADLFSMLVVRATILVAIGVALEGVEFIHDIASWIKRLWGKKRERAALMEVTEFVPVCEIPVKRRRVHSDAQPVLVKVIGYIGLLLVVVGVIGEWKYGAKFEDAQRHLIKAARDAANEAEISAHKARDEADEAEASSKTARNEARAATLLLARLKQYMDGRHIFTPLLTFRSAVSLHPSQSGNFHTTIFPAEDNESKDFAKTLLIFLPPHWEAQVKLHNPPLKREYSGVMVNGAFGDAAIAAKDLVNELNGEGIEATQGRDRTYSLPKNTIEIEVGVRPPFEADAKTALNKKQKTNK
jgi:hypothetical protein